MKSYKSMQISPCPECGKPMITRTYHNIDVVISPDDLESKCNAKKRGFVLRIPPHVDVDCECMLCDFKSHEAKGLDGLTVVINGRLL